MLPNLEQSRRLREGSPWAGMWAVTVQVGS